MELHDIALLILVYIYVILIFAVSETLLKEKESVSRKFVHIMVGNMIFVMPFFASSTNMIWFLTLPITIAAFFLTKYSPIKIKNNVTESGHSLGLVYYAGIWTVLIYIFQDQLWIVSLAIASMVYGDGFASLIGQKFGRHKYKITEEKSVEGSITMFIVTFLAASIVIFFYNSIGYAVEFNIAIILFISLIATIMEAVTPKGLDNITATSATAILYYVFLVIL